MEYHVIYTVGSSLVGGSNPRTPPGYGPRILFCNWLGAFLLLFFVNRTNMCTSPILRNKSFSVCLLKDDLECGSDG